MKGWCKANDAEYFTRSDYARLPLVDRGTQASSEFDAQNVKWNGGRFMPWHPRHDHELAIRSPPQDQPCLTKRSSTKLVFDHPSPLRRNNYEGATSSFAGWRMPSPVGIDLRRLLPESPLHAELPAGQIPSLTAEKAQNIQQQWAKHISKEVVHTELHRLN